MLSHFYPHISYQELLLLKYMSFTNKLFSRCGKKPSKEDKIILRISLSVCVLDHKGGKNNFYTIIVIVIYNNLKKLWF